MADEPAGRTSLGVLHEILTNLGDSNQYHYVVEALEALKNLLGEGGIGEAVSEWLAAHPEVTTTVQNGSITLLKLANDVKSAINGKAESSDLQALADNLATLAQTVAEKADASDLDDKADIDGYYSQLTAGLAENLIGRGDAVPAEYLYRTAGGTADIEDGIATIDCIKGNTLVWNQYADNGNFSEGNRHWGARESTLSVVDGVATAVPNSTGDERGLQASFTMGAAIANHKYLISTEFNTNEATNLNISFSGAHPIRVSVPSTGAWYKCSAIWTSTNRDTRILPYLITAASVTTNAQLKYRNVQIFDLTLMFGSGNEPATVEEFEAMFPLAYYPYSAPKLLPVDIRGIETVGFNAYNSSTGEAELLGGHQYQISGTYTSLSYSTGESIALDSDGIFTPSENGTLTVTGGNATDTCVHLVWSGYRNGEYEEFWSAERPIDTSRFFPTGMKKAGSAADVLYADHYDTVIGAVDLGTLTWSLYNNVFFASVSTMSPDDNQPIQCAAYTVDDSVHSYSGAQNMADKSIAGGIGSDNRYVYVKDSAYSTSADFKAAMSGVILYYELATPTTTPIDPPLNLSYKVSDFGTERIMVDETADAPQTAPVPMEVEYGINAIDTIRRLPKEYQSHKSMGQFTAALESSLGIDITETWDETEQRYEYEVSDFEIADNSIPDTKLAQTGGVLSDVGKLIDGDFRLTNFTVGTLNNSGAIAWGPYAISSTSDTTLDYPVDISVADGYQIRVLRKLDGETYSDSGYIATPVALPSGVAFKLTIRRTGDTSTPADIPLMSSQMRIITKQRYLAEMAFWQSGKLADGEQLIDAYFERGSLGNGVFSANMKCRVATPYVVRYARPITFRVKSGFRIGIHTFDASDTFVSDSGWKSDSFKLDAGQGFKIVVARTTEDTSEIANIGTFYNAVAIDTALKQEVVVGERNIFKQPYMQESKPKLVAHMGYHVSEPENTVPAYVAAATNGFWGIETDIQQTSDGKFVCIHDSTLDRTTNGTGNVADKTLAEIRALHIKDHDDLQVPTFEEYLGVCKAYGCVPIIEIKGTVTNTAAGMSALIAVIKNLGMKDQCILTGSKWSASAVRGATTEIPYIGVFQSGTYQDYATEIEFMRQHANCGVMLETSGTITAEMIQECHEADMPVGVFVVDDQDQAYGWLTSGADMVTTNLVTSLA